MKQTRLIIHTAIFTVFASVLLIFSSCSNACKNMVCENSGNCNGSACSCPSGYSGNLCQLSSIIFVNNAFTEMYINVNGTPGIIPPGVSLTYTDSAGKTAVVTAYTYGTSAGGTVVGDTVKWSMNYAYPTTTVGGTALTEDINVPTTYFYLKIVNNDTALQTVDSIVLNYGGTNGSITTPLSIPANNTSYGIGYYYAFATTSVNAYGTKGGVWTFSSNYLAFLSTDNQTSTITIP